MSRMIDADKMIEFIDKGKYCDPNALTFSENEVCAMIDEQPTAYDVDKVVENLKEIEVGGDCRHKCKSYDWSVGACEGDCKDYVKSEAIDIVKRGGVDD